MRADLLAVEFDRQSVGSRERVPVYPPQVVAGLVIAVIAEFERGAGLPAQLKSGEMGRGRSRRFERVPHPRLLPGNQIFLVIIIHRCHTTLGQMFNHEETENTKDRFESISSDLLRALRFFVVCNSLTRSAKCQ